MSEDFDPYEEDFWRDFDCEPECPTCRGTGIVNALTAPKDMPYFVASHADCPHCDGAGYAQ